MRRRYWVRGKALKTLFAFRQLQVGDEVIVNEPVLGPRAEGTDQDATLINGKPLRVKRTSGGYAIVTHPRFTSYYVPIEHVVAWRAPSAPEEEK
jgi:hypothetical protein